MRIYSNSRMTPDDEFMNTQVTRLGNRADDAADKLEYFLNEVDQLNRDYEIAPDYVYSEDIRLIEQTIKTLREIYRRTSYSY